MKELDKYKNQLTVSCRKFDSKNKDKILNWREYYRGNQWEKSDGYTDLVVDNMIFSNIRALLPKLNLRNPKIFVRAKKKPYRTDNGIFDTLKGAIAWEYLLNYYYKELKIRRTARKCLVDAFLGYWGIVQIGYSVETEKIKNDTLIEVDELIKSDSPFVTRISPMNFRTDIEGTDSQLDDANWCAVKWVKSIEDIKNNSFFENTRGLKSNASIDTSFAGNTLTKEQETRGNELWERVEGWTLWDKKNKRLLSIVQEHDKFLHNSKWPLEYEGFPFETLYFNENPDELMPVADIDIYMPQQDELNRMLSLQLDHIRNLAQQKYISRTNVFSETEKMKLTYGGNGTIIESDGNPLDALVPVQRGSIAQDVYIVAQLVKKSLREAAGISEMEKLVGGAQESATESNILSMGIQSIREDQRDTFEDFVKRIIRKLAQVIQQTTGETEIALDDKGFEAARQYLPDKLEKITGADNKTTIYPFLTLSKDDIKGEYEFDIEIGSTQPINEEARKRDTLMLAQMLAGNRYIKERDGIMKLFEDFNRPDMEELVKPEEQVQQESQAEMEFQLKLKEMETMPKQQTDMKKTEMKSQTALATTKMKGDVEIAKENIKHMSAVHTKDMDVKGGLLSEALKGMAQENEEE